MATETASYILNSGVAQRPEGREEHDYFLLDEQEGYFAVLDGSGWGIASMIGKNVMAQMLQAEPVAPLNVMFAEMHKAILKNGQNTTTTATGFRIVPSAAPLLDGEWAQNGDSSLWLLDRETDQLTKITRDENYRWPNGNTDNSVFLGGANYQLRQFGRLILPARATIALFTDGVISGEQGDTSGLSERKLRKSLASSDDPRERSARLIKDSKFKGNGTAVVIDLEVHRVESSVRLPQPRIELRLPA